MLGETFWRSFIPRTSESPARSESSESLESSVPPEASFAEWNRRLEPERFSPPPTLVRNICHASTLSTPTSKWSQALAEYHAYKDDNPFCHDLVVPNRCECVLFLPIRPVARIVHIVDSTGTSMLQAELRTGVMSLAGGLQGRQNSGAAAVPDVTRLVLCMASRPGVPIAQGCLCGRARERRDGDSGGGSCGGSGGGRGGGGCDGATFQVLRASGEVFAELAPNGRGDCYTLTTLNGNRIYFRGGPTGCNTRVLDDAAKLVAYTTGACAVDFEADTEYYQLHVAPLSDAGLLVVSLLCIQHLAFSNPALTPAATARKA